MNLVHTAIRYPPAIGGVELYVQQLCEGLASRGHGVKVYTSDLDQHMQRTYLKTGLSQSEGEPVSVERLHASFLPGLGGYPLLLGLPGKLAGESPDVFHGHCFYYSTADLTATIARIKRRPFVFNPYYYPPGTPNWRAYRKTIGQMVMNADVVVCISEFEKKLIEASRFSVKRFEVVSPGVDLQEFEHPHLPFYERYGIDVRKKHVLLFVGRLAPEKGLDILLQSFSSALDLEPEMVLVVAGPDAGYQQIGVGLAASLGCAQNTVFTGPLDRIDLVAAFQQATLFVFPTRYEAFGIVLVEAMAAGLPIVASRAAAVPFVVPDRECGLLSPVGDSSTTARNIVELVRNPALRARLSHNAREHVKGNFDMGLQTLKMEAVYESLRK